jgi:hypothetical protein
MCAWAKDLGSCLGTNYALSLSGSCMHSGLRIRNFVLFYLKNAQSSEMKLGNIFVLKQSERCSASWVVPMSQE